MIMHKFQNLSTAPETMPDRNWEIFQELRVIKDTVERASEAEMSSHIRSTTFDLINAY